MSESLEIDLDAFWSLIDQAKKRQDNAGNWLAGQMTAQGPDSLVDAPDYRDRQFCSLALAGGGAYGGDTRSFDSYEYLVLKEEVRRSVVYGDGIGYPYDWPDIPAYVPRLYAKYFTGEQRHRCTGAALRVNTWNLNNPSIKAARKVARKDKKVKDRGAR